jgi:hypothetical protein
MKDHPNQYLILSGILIAACIVGIIFHFLPPAASPEPVPMSGIPDPDRLYSYSEFINAKSEIAAFEGPYDEPTIDRLIGWIGKGSVEMGEIPENKLRAVSAADDSLRKMINAKLTSRLDRQCVEMRADVVEQSEFTTLRTYADLLADQKLPEALDLLIECSTIQGEISGFGSGHFLTYSAIKKYGESAEPVLMNKYDAARPELRHVMINLIADIDGPYTVKNLRSVRARENDPKLRKVLDHVISNLVREQK